MTRRERTYYAWLNNAYAQELCMARMYRMHARDVSRGLNSFPELQQKLEEQAQTCLLQAKRMQACYQRVSGRRPFTPKTWLGNVMGVILGWTGDVTIDKVIMNNLTDYGMIQFEIAAYHTLIAAAKEMDDSETLRVCEEILKEEQAFARWLMPQVGPSGQEFLQRVDKSANTPS